MSLYKEFKAVTLSGALAVTGLLSGCGEPVLPRIRNASFVPADDPNCVIRKSHSFQRGIILSILAPFIPEKSSSDNTNIDRGCMDRNIAQAAFQKTDTESRVIAVAIYDQLSPGEKQIMDQQFRTLGTSIEELAAGMPRITGTIASADKNCVRVNFQLPDADDKHQAFLIRCARAPS